MIGIGVIGCGRWGPNYIRNFDNFPDVAVLQCCDLETNRLESLRERYRNITMTGDYHEILDNSDIDAVVIATPASTHYQIAKDSLLAGKDTLVEKPLALDVKQVMALADIARKTDKVLMTGHIFVYNDYVAKVKEIISDGFGRIRYMCATRTNLGPVRQDVNVIWDLAVHDVSIFLYLLESAPTEVSATGHTYLQENIEDVAFINMSFPDGVLANIRVSWLDPRKVRMMSIIGTEKMVVFDDIDNYEPIRIYNKGVDNSKEYDSFGEFQLRFRDGDIVSPKVVAGEPLRNQCAHFLECVRTRSEPITNGANTCEVVKTLCAIQESAKLHGAPVEVK